MSECYVKSCFVSWFSLTKKVKTDLEFIFPLDPNLYTPMRDFKTLQADF